VLAAVLVYVQIVFGALLTHAGRIDLHLAGALLVFVFVPIVAAQLRRTGDAVAAPISRLVTVLLGIQLLLGLGSYLARFSPMWIPGEQLTVTALPVAHRLVGSLILAATVILAVRMAGHAEPARTSGLSAGPEPGRASGLSAEPEPGRASRLSADPEPGRTSGLSAEPEPGRASRLSAEPEPGRAFGLSAEPEPRRAYVRPPSIRTGLTDPATT
jgi:hypothetical protein